MSNSPLRIGIVAGESSGDILGASLLKSFREQLPDCVVEGVGGPRMIAEGCESLFAMDRLSVMGLIEPLKRLPELLHMRKTLVQHFVANPPDVFIGIDSPDFNLGIERRLKQQGIKTVHYVSPSVWAWRQKRIVKIKQSVDLMLTLFPFEQEIYKQNRIPVAFVGHPLADTFPDHTDAAKCCGILGIDARQRWVALLPGSRENEVKLLAPILLEAARQCLEKDSALHFLMPAANEKRAQQLQDLLDGSDLPVTLIQGQSHEVMGASELVVMASGTTTLEALLLKRPMVVTYRMAALSYAIISRMVKTPWVSLPNLLAQRELVPELIQQQASADNIARHMLDILGNADTRQQLTEEFLSIHRQLRCNAGERAATAVLGLINQV